MNHEELAKIVHTVNRAYCIAIGEEPQELWENISDEMKESTYVGINYILNHPTATASTLHRNWRDIDRNGLSWLMVGYMVKKKTKRKRHILVWFLSLIFLRSKKSKMCCLSK